MAALVDLHLFLEYKEQFSGPLMLKGGDILQDLLVFAGKQCLHLPRHGLWGCDGKGQEGGGRDVSGRQGSYLNPALLLF